jgi:hypothetical protein
MTERKDEKYNSNVVYKKKPLEMALNCTQGINLSCGYCGKYHITKTKHDGCDCTLSSCKMGFWVGASNWNRLCVI